VPAKVAALRSRESESEATRRAILDAAEHLLATVGESGLSIREVCARAGVTAPTIYHHFGDKAALVARVVDDCFSAFERAFAHRAVPADPVEALRWAFDGYVEYGLRHPIHYRLMFGARPSRPSAPGLASYDGLRRRVMAIAEAGRLVAPIEDATAAFWASVHGVTSLLINDFWAPETPAIALVRDAMIAQLTTPRSVKPRRTKGTSHERA
jgi:AcrR family transcriptional regulator